MRTNFNWRDPANALNRVRRSHHFVLARRRLLRHADLHIAHGQRALSNDRVGVLGDFV